MMKKLFVLAALGFLVAGCASSKKTQSVAPEGLTDQYAKYQIVDQEFDNLVVPNDNYNRVASYEDQVSATSYIQSSVKAKSSKKPARTVKVQKTVVDGQGNILPADASAPVTDEEALPDEPDHGANY